MTTKHLINTSFALMISSSLIYRGTDQRISHLLLILIIGTVFMSPQSV